jgi:hypothetical protein
MTYNFTYLIYYFKQDERLNITKKINNNNNLRMERIHSTTTQRQF